MEGEGFSHCTDVAAAADVSVVSGDDDDDEGGDGGVCVLCCAVPIAAGCVSHVELVKRGSAETRRRRLLHTRTHRAAVSPSLNSPRLRPARNPDCPSVRPFADPGTQDVCST